MWLVALLVILVIGVAAVVMRAPENTRTQGDRGGSVAQRDAMNSGQGVVATDALGNPTTSATPATPEPPLVPNIPVPAYEGGITLAGKASPLIEFNQKDYDQAVKEGKVVVLYFYANWCPICKNETETALYPIFNQLRDRNVVGFRVNYKDTDTDASELALAKEFSVAYQHTKVILKGSKMITKSGEVWDLKRYETEISNASLK